MGPLAGDWLGGAVYLDIDIQLLGQSYWEPKKLGGEWEGGRERGRGSEGGGREGEREGGRETGRRGGMERGRICVGIKERKLLESC